MAFVFPSCFEQVATNLRSSHTSIRGATYCLFQREYGELLGLNVEAGQRLVFSTVAGSVEAYGHVVTLECLGLTMESTVFFFANERIQKSVLGRNGWLNRIRLGLVDHDRYLFLAPYDL